ncbi:hypothetical protein [Chitinophaga rhizosphaerae]|uniref:hypothetical protein n=1 Tax=Chitinophaga rhizosphaerae TaxID=1864947 RepID=UPI000F81435F|nr:hypothetical protein [Chitinophaga rhizosphaerae]
MNNLFRYIAVFYAQALLLVKTMALPIMCLEYQLNKAFIAANLCENRDKPIMQCGGKCHLSKQIERSGETPDPQSSKTGIKSISFDIYQPVAVLQLDDVDGSSLSHRSFQDNRSAAGFAHGIFHPPIA